MLEAVSKFQLDEREHGQTFKLENICWIDFETRSQTADIKETGAYRYAAEADAIVLAWAIGDEPVTVTAVEDFRRPLHGDTLPPKFWEFHERVQRGEAIWAAWNASFDRAIWNYATLDFPLLDVHEIIDVMAQATAAGLPPDLRVASKICGHAKLSTGRDLIRDFCTPTATKTPQTHPEDWKEFLMYAKGDINSMRAVFAQTMQLPMAEWREYWAMEAINSRGVRVDLDMAEHAHTLAELDRKEMKRTIADLTEGAVESVDMVAKLIAWLLERLPPEGQQILTKREEETDEEGNVTRPAKHALTRKQVQRLLAYVEGVKNPPLLDHQKILNTLQLRLYGGSRTPAKFGKVLKQHVDGKLYGQYVFNGAGQTGRASSRGVQVHNLARETLPYEHDAIEALLNKYPYNMFREFGDDTPVARKLSLLIRPLFVPDSGHQFVWGDWAQIEARVLPWLCGPASTGAMARVVAFQACDADPSLPDLYTRSAAEISHCRIDEVTKDIRQRGKVAELALGYMGGVGSLLNMAAGYGLHLSHDEAQHIVWRWREANAWAVNFSQLLWEAMHDAVAHPDCYRPVGRVGFIFLSDYAGGSLLLRLPSGRCLTYRSFRVREFDVTDEDGEPSGRKEPSISCWRGHGPIKIWPGIFVENATQAVAADVLRGTLRRLEEAGYQVHLHTHDEVVLQTPDGAQEQTSIELSGIMTLGFDWSEGLPLKADITVASYYTKVEP